LLEKLQTLGYTPMQMLITARAVMQEAKKPENGDTAQSAGRAAVTQDEKNWGMFCHVAVFAGFLFPLGNIIGPLIIWLLKKEQYAFVDYNARQAMNFQITFLIAMLVSALLAFVLIGILMLIGFGIFALVVTIRAILAAGRGDYYAYPCSIRFIR
jgi:uncharacterized Tic20 family protein